MNLDDLKKPFPPEKVSFRIGSRTGDKSRGIGLAYIDARDVMERLDEVCGPENWQALYPHANGKTSCKIGIKVGKYATLPDGEHMPITSFEWVWKENGAGDTDIEGEKGAFSDAFKRAAVLWGIGRYLYDMPNVWVPLENEGKKFAPAALQQLRAELVKLSGIAPQAVPEDNSKARETQYDYINEINGICDLEELDAYWLDNGEFAKALPGDYGPQVVDQYEARMQQLKRGETAPGPYKFLNVGKMKSYLVLAETELKRCDNQQELEMWKALNRREAQALDKTRKPELGAMVAAREAQLKLAENNSNLRQAG